MALTKDFRDTIRERAQRDASFRRALLREAIELMLCGDVETGQNLMRNYINATVGFPDLAGRTSTPKNSLMRMFGPKGNPSSRNMFGVIAELAKAEGINLSLRATAAKGEPRTNRTFSSGGRPARVWNRADAQAVE